ncbi:MAG: sugar-binding domain-containing protein [Bacteroidota bacterium]
MYRKRNITLLRFALILVLSPALVSCGHGYNSHTMDLVYYQWNFWTEEGADEDAPAPSCGWDEMHRGVGKLVRIPASVGEYFSSDYTGVSWFHVRFTLPDPWAGKEISLHFEGINGNTRVFLNQELVGTVPLTNGPFRLDVTGKIYYVRDNHLDIRITDPRPGMGGVTGKIILEAASPNEGIENDVDQ